MKLLDEIIAFLSDQSGSLTDALLKTKVLMHKIGHKELAEWVNNELNGYAQDAEVPTYRIVSSKVMGTMSSMVMMYNNQPVPIKHLSKGLQEYFTVHKARASIATLENYAKAKGSLTIPIAPEYYRKLGETLIDGIGIQRAWIQMEPSQFLSTLTELRSRLLDFVLGLQSELGDVEKESEVKEAAKSIDAAGMFRGAVFGDNTTVVVGNHNTTTITNQITRGDFDSLAAALKSKGVSDGDAAELKTAIATDGTQIDTVKKEPGPAVKGWMKRMLGKVVDTSWQIELGVAGNLLTDAIKAFYF